MQTDSTFPAPFDTATFIFPAEWHALSDVFGGAGTGVLFLQNGAIAHVNRNLCMRLGFDESELIGQPLETIFPEGNDAPAVASGKLLRHDDDPAEGVRVRLLNKVGERVDFDLLINRVDTLTNASCTIWVLQAADASAPTPSLAVESAARMLVDHAPLLLAVIEPDATLHYVGGAPGALLGHDRLALRGTSFYELVHGDDRPALQRLLAAPDGQTLTLRARHADGDWHRLAVQIERLPLENDAPRDTFSETPRLLLAARDIAQHDPQSQDAHAAQKRQLHYLNRLFRLAQRPHSDLKSALKVILKASTKALGIHACSYWEAGTAPSENRCVMAYDDIKQHYREDAVPEAPWSDTLHQLLQQTLLNPHPQPASDVDQDPRAALFCEYFHPAGIKAAILVPVQRAGRDAGVLMLTQAGEAHNWRKDEIDFAANVGNLLTQVFNEVDQSRKESHSRQLAHHDSLTGLPNRHFLFDRAADILPKVSLSSPSLAAFFIDLDGFKTINEAHGHATGDELLKAAAQRLRNAVRKDDVLVRLGGDEFMLLARDVTELRVADDIAAQIVDSMRNPFALEGQELRISASIGVAMYPQDGKDIDTLMQKADIAMVHAKSGGRDRYHMFTPMLAGTTSQRSSLETELRRALEENEFQHYYQPQIDLRTGKVRSVEALLRWHHPEHGVLLPTHFLPSAEQSGLMQRISAWVLNDACARLRIWRKRDVGEFSLALNLSASQLLDPKLLTVLETALDRNGITGRQLEWEIKESTAMQLDAVATSLLDRLVAMQVSLSVDNFGTGQSSLAYLQRYPVHKVKIDRSFISGLPGEADDRAVTDAVISLARPLGLDVVAEGVETQQQMDYLREHGCDLAQGYFFTQPLTADQFEKWLIRH